MYLSIEFQETYKRLDRLCKDYLSSNEGVSEYIRQMESATWTDKKLVPSWETDYKQLKHIRWVRNQLAHEVGAFEAGICTIEDLNYAKYFYNRIIQRNDPFSLIQKARKETQKQKQTNTRLTTSTTPHTNKNKPTTSLWQKIVTKFKRWFRS